MIFCFVVVNNAGVPRLVKFYDSTPAEKRHGVVKEIHRRVSEAREAPDDSTRRISGILAAADLFPETNARLVWKNFITLSVVAAVDESESPLSCLDFIQLYVGVLNAVFVNVCELDLIFGFEEAHYILDAMIIGGLIHDNKAKSILEVVKTYGLASGGEPLTSAGGGVNAPSANLLTPSFWRNLGF